MKGNFKNKNKRNIVVALEWLTPKEIAKLDNLLSEIREVLPYIFSNNDNVVSYKAVYEKGNKMIDFEIEKP